MQTCQDYCWLSEHAGSVVVHCCFKEMSMGRSYLWNTGSEDTHCDNSQLHVHCLFKSSFGIAETAWLLQNHTKLQKLSEQTRQPTFPRTAWDGCKDTVLWEHFAVCIWEKKSTKCCITCSAEINLSSTEPLVTSGTDETWHPVLLFPMQFRCVLLK